MSNTPASAPPSADEPRSSREAADVTAGARSLFRRFLDSEFRNELVALAAVFLAMQLFLRSLPVGLYALGLTEGAKLALSALAILLVYRANRFANFAQLALAGFAQTVFMSLVNEETFLDLARATCGCVSRRPEGAPVVVNYVLALVVVIAGAALLSFGFYATLLRRFTRAPRLMLTLFTVFAAEVLAESGSQVSRLLAGGGGGRDNNRIATPPWDFEWTIDDFTRLDFSRVGLVVAACAALVGVARFLRTSDTGVAIRAASESPDRARTLGVDVVTVTGRVWLLAGVLAGVSGVLGAMGAGGSGGQAQVLDVTCFVLFVAVVAKFRSFPMMALAAVVMGTLKVAVPFSFRTADPLTAVLVFMLGGILLLQRHRETRADREEGSAFELVNELRPVPRELRHLPQVAAWVRNGLILAVLLLLGLPWALAPNQATTLTMYLIFVIIGLSVLVVTGWMGQVSLGQFGFAGIGAWGAAVSGLPMPVAVVAGGCLGAVAAVVVGLPALRLKGLNLAITTLAFAVSVPVLFLSDRYLGKLLPGSVDRPRVLGMDFDDPRVFYYAMVVVVACVTVGVVGLRRSRTGRALIAIRANESTGQSFGVDVLRLRLTAFAVSGFMAAFAGALLAFHFEAVDAALFDVRRSLEVFIFSVVGGLGGIAGPISGFAFMAFVRFFPSNPVLAYLDGGMGGMLILTAAPGGLAQLLYDVRDSALRRLAVRLRIVVPSLMGDRAAARAFDRALLDENRRGARSGSLPPLRYRLPHQWALDRFAAADNGRSPRAASDLETSVR